MKMPQFVVLTYPRTGSTLLCGTLSWHPDICEGMEMFHEKHIRQYHRHEAWRVKKFQELYGKTQDEMRAVGPYGQDILDSHRFDFVPFIRDFVQEFNGFKLCYHQLRVDSPVWDFYLSEVPFVKIIYMRRDFLEACTSFYLSVHTNVWQRFKPDDDVKEAPFELRPRDLQEFYHRFCSYESAYRRRLQTLESMEVNYQQILDDWEGTFKRVQEFIGIEPQKVENLGKPTYKKTTLSTRQLIKNYDELMNGLCGLSPLDYAKGSLPL